MFDILSLIIMLAVFIDDSPTVPIEPEFPKFSSGCCRLFSTSKTGFRLLLFTFCLFFVNLLKLLSSTDDVSSSIS